MSKNKTNAADFARSIGEATCEAFIEVVKDMLRFSSDNADKTEKDMVNVDMELDCTKKSFRRGYSQGQVDTCSRIIRELEHAQFEFVHTPIPQQKETIN